MKTEHGDYIEVEMVECGRVRIQLTTIDMRTESGSRTTAIVLNDGEMRELFHWWGKPDDV